MPGRARPALVLTSSVALFSALEYLATHPDLRDRLYRAGGLSRLAVLIAVDHLSPTRLALGFSLLFALSLSREQKKSLAPLALATLSLGLLSWCLLARVPTAEPTENPADSNAIGSLVGDAPPSGSSSHPDIVLVTVDGLSFDDLSSMPTLSAIASRSSFSNLVTPLADHAAAALALLTGAIQDDRGPSRFPEPLPLFSSQESPSYFAVHLRTGPPSAPSLFRRAGFLDLPDIQLDHASRGQLPFELDRVLHDPSKPSHLIWVSLDGASDFVHPNAGLLGAPGYRGPSRFSVQPSDSPADDAEQHQRIRLHTQSVRALESELIQLWAVVAHHRASHPVELVFTSSFGQSTADPDRAFQERNELRPVAIHVPFFWDGHPPDHISSVLSAATVLSSSMGAPQLVFAQPAPLDVQRVLAPISPDLDDHFARLEASATRRRAWVETGANAKLTSWVLEPSHVQRAIRRDSSDGVSTLISPSDSPEVDKIEHWLSTDLAMSTKFVRDGLAILPRAPWVVPPSASVDTSAAILERVILLVVDSPCFRNTSPTTASARWIESSTDDAKLGLSSLLTGFLPSELGHEPGGSKAILLPDAVTMRSGQVRLLSSSHALAETVQSWSERGPKAIAEIQDVEPFLQRLEQLASIPTSAPGLVIAHLDNRDGKVDPARIFDLTLQAIPPKQRASTAVLLTSSYGATLCGQSRSPVAAPSLLAPLWISPPALAESLPPALSSLDLAPAIARWLGVHIPTSASREESRAQQILLATGEHWRSARLGSLRLIERDPSMDDDRHSVSVVQAEQPGNTPHPTALSSDQRALLEAAIARSCSNAATESARQSAILAGSRYTYEDIRPASQLSIVFRAGPSSRRYQMEIQATGDPRDVEASITPLPGDLAAEMITSDSLSSKRISAEVGANQEIEVHLQIRPAHAKLAWRVFQDDHPISPEQFFGGPVAMAFPWLSRGVAHRSEWEKLHWWRTPPLDQEGVRVVIHPKQ